MQSRKLTAGQLGAWLAAALSAPLAQIAGGVPWQQTALLAAVCLSACWLLSRGSVKPGRLLCLVELLWIACVLGSAVRWMEGSWPSGQVYPAVPLVLLALGAVSASRGTEAAGRAGSVLSWLLALIFGAVALAGAGEVELENLRTGTASIDGRLISIFLVPAVAVFLRGGRSAVPLRSLLAVGLFAIAVSVLVMGALSAPVALAASVPLYEWVSGLSLLNTLQRFESVVAVGLTMGWFALTSILLCSAGHLAEGAKTGTYRYGVWICAALAGITVLSKGWISQEILAAGCILLWVAVPLWSAAMQKNKSEIFKNNA